MFGEGTTGYAVSVKSHQSRAQRKVSFKTVSSYRRATVSHGLQHLPCDGQVHGTLNGLITSYDKGRSGSVYKKGHYHPYERTESKPDNRKQDRPAWKNLSRGHNKRSKGKHQYSSRPAKGQQPYQ